ncbi:MAG TPA: NIPSNAP family protein, partial [Dehalococcoidia bacterium]|nr:NIPSNAP family protein [Dehalococcoidia bacterium]
MRTYTVQPNKVPDYEKRFGEAYSVRANYSKMGGMWHTEIGPLNQVIHIWPYEDLQQRADIRGAALKDPSGKWPPQSGEILLAQQVDILDPVANMKPWGEP